MRLPLRKREDPMLTTEELRVIRELLQAHIDWAVRVMTERRVSEAIIRTRMDAESALAKVQQVLAR